MTLADHVSWCAAVAAQPALGRGSVPYPILKWPPTRRPNPAESSPSFTADIGMGCAAWVRLDPLSLTGRLLGGFPEVRTVTRVVRFTREV